MRDAMKRLGLAGLLVIPLSPFAAACYAPRIESCRGALGDFNGVTEVELIDVRESFGFFEGPAGGGASFQVSAHTTSPVQCIAVRSELRRGDVVVHTLETTVRTTTRGEVLTSSPLFHYRSGDSVVVTTLGTTLEADLSPPDAGASVDASTSDAGDGG